MNGFEEVYHNIKEAAISGEVADAAGIAPQKWGLRHVFYGNGPHIKGRNRGRAPYIEIVIDSSDFTQININEQTEDLSFLVRIYAKGNEFDAVTRTQAIGRAFLRELRSFDNIYQWTTNISQLEPTPWGGYIDIRIATDLGDRFTFSEGD